METHTEKMCLRGTIKGEVACRCFCEKLGLKAEMSPLRQERCSINIALCTCPRCVTLGRDCLA